MKPVVKLYHYGQVKWFSGKPRQGFPVCPKCEHKELKPKELLRYSGTPCTELFVDYECRNCRYKFTVNWS